MIYHHPFGVGRDGSRPLTIEPGIVYDPTRRLREPSCRPFWCDDGLGLPTWCSGYELRELREDALKTAVSSYLAQRWQPRRMWNRTTTDHYCPLYPCYLLLPDPEGNVHCLFFPQSEFATRWLRARHCRDTGKPIDPYSDSPWFNKYIVSGFFFPEDAEIALNPPFLTCEWEYPLSTLALVFRAAADNPRDPMAFPLLGDALEEEGFSGAAELARKQDLYWALNATIRLQEEKR